MPDYTCQVYGFCVCNTGSFLCRLFLSAIVLRAATDVQIFVNEQIFEYDFSIQIFDKVGKSITVVVKKCHIIQKTHYIGAKILPNTS